MKFSPKALFKAAAVTPYDREKPIRSFLHKIIRIVFFSFKSFYQKELYLKSSLLTFYSLIALVPILTIILSIAKGFGFDAFLQKQLLETFKEQQDVISIAFRFAYAIIEQMQSPAIVGIGVFFLFFSVYGLFVNIEKSLNAIWNVKKHRKLIRRMINYAMALIFFPIIFIASTSITIFINTEITRTAQNYEFVASISHYVLTVLKLAPYGLMFALFSYVYLFTPNTAIAIKPRIFAGILAGVIFQFWQIIYIDSQVYLSSYNAVYGSFAALPLFLIWMQINFVILLFGAEIAAQIEGDRFFKKTTKDDHFKMVNKKHLCLIVLHTIVFHYLKGEKPLSLNRISEELGISSLDAREIFNILEKAHIIAELKTSERYHLIINPELFTIQSLSNMLDEIFFKKGIAKETKSLYAVTRCLTQFDESIKSSNNDLNLKDFINTD